VPAIDSFGTPTDFAQRACAAQEINLTGQGIWTVRATAHLGTPELARHPQGDLRVLTQRLHRARTERRGGWLGPALPSSLASPDDSLLLPMKSASVFTG
jgi:hypothetical protein